MRHRVMAINGLNEFLSRSSFSITEAEAAMATMMILCYQSCLLDDGINEYLDMVRGCESHLPGLGMGFY